MSTLPFDRTTAAALALVWFGATHLSAAQQTYPEKPSDPDADADFKAIFDGRSLAGWEGDPRYWRVENGCIVGEVTPETLLQQNSFLVWREGAPRDFELKVACRISPSGNSGVNYRSEEVAGVPFALRGYQADIDGDNPKRPDIRHTANNYEERGRTFMALRGQITRAEPEGRRTIIGSVGDYIELTRHIDDNGWNELHIIARGPVLTHILHGQVMSIVIDEDPDHRRMVGLVGVQVHVGPPMKVEYRDFRLKNISR
ncbi:MAG: 3-keto-disaccharide hydrolase [Opitutaceae bacterium]